MLTMRLKAQLKLINKALKRLDEDPFLYSDEEIVYMKKQRLEIKTSLYEKKQERRRKKGFSK
tara:strand:- start:802 stop:987 length:186 start_codon:yes stop_codon:yes gene_type:complete